MRKFYKIFIVTILTVLLALPIVACSKDQPNYDDPITFTDSVGRTVVLDKLPEKIAVLDHYSAEVIRALGAANKLVAICNYMKDEGISYWGSLVNLPAVGMYNDINTNNMETMRMQGAELVITSDIGYAKTVETLENAGFKVAVINCYKPLSYADDVNLIGLVIGQTAKAKELADYYTSILNTISSYINSIAQSDRKTVYYEGANQTSVGNLSGWHEVIELAGGINIYGDITSGTITATEASVQKNPDFIWCYYNGNMTPNTTDMQYLYNELMKRSGWNNMSALKNSNIFVLNYWAAKSFGKLYAIVTLAEILYPDLFSNLNANDIAEKWYTEYQSVAFNQNHIYYPQK